MIAAVGSCKFAGQRTAAEPVDNSVGSERELPGEARRGHRTSNEQHVVIDDNDQAGGSQQSTLSFDDVDVEQPLDARTGRQFQAGQGNRVDQQHSAGCGLGFGGRGQ